MANEDLREVATRAIANYMHHELNDVINTGVEMLPWVKGQAESIMSIVDGAIDATRNHTLSKKGLGHDR